MSENAIVEAQPNAMMEPSAGIIAAAQRLPDRDLPAITNRIREVAISDPVLAKKCIWVRTVGKKDNLDQFKLGPSVRMTEIAHQQLGMIWMTPPQFEEKDRSLQCTALAFDLQKLNIYAGHSSKSIYRKDGSRFAENVIATTRSALYSIAKREAILTGYRAQIDSIMDDVKDCIIRSICPEGSEEAGLKQAWEELVGMYERFGVTEDQMKKAVENEGNNRDKVVLLFGIYNSIKEGVVSVKDVFSPDNNTRTRPQTTAPKAKETPRPQQKTAPESPQKLEPNSDDQQTIEASEPQAEASEVRDGRANREKFVDDLNEIALEKGLKTQREIDAICIREFSANSSKIGASSWGKVLAHFRKLEPKEEASE